jgi:hypothetical protein
MGLLGMGVVMYLLAFVLHTHTLNFEICRLWEMGAVVPELH